MDRDELQIIVPEEVITVRDCQYCPHHSCYMTEDGLECSCDLRGTTQTSGIPHNCPLKSSSQPIPS